MEVILLERISRLGGVGDVVKVKPGFARNFLFPLKKALRATKDNKEVFETKRAALEKQSEQARVAAEKSAAGMQNLSVTIIRQASEDGKLYGSVAVRDVAEALKESGHDVERRLIDLTTAIKALGVYEATISLHPEVKVRVKINIARNAESLLAAELEAKPEEEAHVEEETSAAESSRDDHSDEDAA